MITRRSFLVALALTAGLLSSGREVFAQFSITISVDENGKGNLSNTTGFNSSLSFNQKQDPGPGGLASALTYDLLNPPGLTAGDLLILDPTTFTLSDVVRFNPNETGAGGGTGTLVFYSAATDTPHSLADIGFPTALYANNLTMFETGPASGPNGVTYTPTSGQPGFVSGAGGPITYVITSTAVPEPGSMVLGSVTVLGGLAIAWARRKWRPAAA